ncbi:hypothetical protein [Nonomuraea sp. NPDC049750]|uniref:hypothetical protein n=1 Tax=Nonomuraea sp. NPDC049750 TaxID=3154738 RepID=UPI0033D33D75
MTVRETATIQVTVTASPELLPAHRGPLTLDWLEDTDVDSKSLTGDDAEIDIHVAYIVDEDDRNNAQVDFVPMNDAKLNVASGQVSSRAECEAMPAHDGNGWQMIGARKDDIVCVRTASGTVARLQVIKFGEDTVTLDATVWRR